MSDSDDDRCCEGDTIIALGPYVGPNSRVAIRHTANHEFVPVIARPSEEGRPIGPGEQYAHPRVGAEGIWDVEDTSSKRGKGPAKVNSAAYRNGWDTIFGGRTPVGEA